MSDMSEPFSDDEILKLDKEMMYREAVRGQSTAHSPDLKMMASAGLIDWLIEKGLDSLGQVYEYCRQMQTDPVGQAELLQFDMNDRQALAKVISKVDPVAGQPMMLFVLDPPG